MIRKDCFFYHCEHMMNASIDCCSQKGVLGICPCTEDCKDYANKHEVYKYGLECIRKQKEKGE